MWQIWLIASGIFFVIEIFTIGFLIFWLGVAALIAMLISLILQTAVFVISSGLLIFATRPLTNKIAGKETIPTNVYSLIGKRGIVVEDIDWQKGTGQVKIEGELWSVKTNEQINISKGTEVEVENIEGVKVFVKPINITSNI